MKVKIEPKIARKNPLIKLPNNNPSMMKNIELALQFGKWILLENVGEDLDPALEPVLLK